MGRGGSEQHKDGLGATPENQRDRSLWSVMTAVGPKAQIMGLEVGGERGRRCHSALPPLPIIQDPCGSYTFIPYTVTAHGEVLCCESSPEQCPTEQRPTEQRPTELPLPGCDTEPFTPLTARLVRLLEGVPTNSWYHQPTPGAEPNRAQRRAAAHVAERRSAPHLRPPTADISGRPSDVTSAGRGSCSGASS